MSTAKALTAGLFGAIATIAIASLLPKTMALELLSIVFGGIAFVYFGFVLIDGRRREMFIEFGNIGLTIALALLGLWIAPYWLAIGYLAHGLWDALHHPRGVQTNIPRWYIPFCLTYDWVVGVFILLWWR